MGFGCKFTDFSCKIGRRAPGDFDVWQNIYTFVFEIQMLIILKAEQQ